MAQEFARTMRVDAAEEALLARTIKAGSKSFDMASAFLPPRCRLPARALYAFCRSSDDAVDASGSCKATELLHARLSRIVAGEPEDRLEDRAFAQVMRRWRIPADIPRALIEGFEWDEQGRRYQTLPELCAYATRVASTVGVMMAMILGVRQATALARACDLGIAMQLTNIARDVGEDARNGRLYLPMEWMAQEGIDADDFLAVPRFSPALARVVRRLLGAADLYYARGMSGISALPADCRPAIAAAAMIYRAIGDSIARNGHDSVGVRATTSRRLKLTLLARSAATVFASRPIDRAAPEPSARFLIDAAADPEARLPTRGLDARAGRFVELLAQIERNERERTAVARMRG